jgi:hypothetical protein
MKVNGKIMWWRSSSSLSWPRYQMEVTSHLVCFTPGKGPWQPLPRRLCGPQNGSGRRGWKKNLLPLSGVELRSSRPWMWFHSYENLNLIYPLPLPSHLPWFCRPWKELGRLTRRGFLTLFRQLLGLLWNSYQPAVKANPPTQNNTI